MSFSKVVKLGGCVDPLADVTLTTVVSEGLLGRLVCLGHGLDLGWRFVDKLLNVVLPSLRTDVPEPLEVLSCFTLAADRNL